MSQSPLPHPEPPMGDDTPRDHDQSDSQNGTSPLGASGTRDGGDASVARVDKDASSATHEPGRHTQNEVQHHRVEGGEDEGSQGQTTAKSVGDETREDEEDDEEEDDEEEASEESEEGEGSRRKPRVVHTRIGPPTNASRSRGKQTDAAEGVKGTKAGNPGNFHGEPYLFLESLMQDYQSAKTVSGKGRNNRYGKFWATTFSAFWDRFEWTQFPEFGDAREVVIKKVNKAIKAWYRYRANTVDRGGKDPWTPVMAELHTKPRPQRKKAAYQYWAKEHKEEIDAAVGASARGIGNRNRVARELFEQASDDVKTAMQELADEEYESASTSYADRLDSLPTPTAEEQALGRKRMHRFAVPFLRTMAKFTGYSCISLIGAVPTPEDPDNAYSWVAVHHGETSDVFPKNMATHDKEAFKGWVETFLNFVKEVQIPEQAPAAPNMTKTYETNDDDPADDPNDDDPTNDDPTNDNPTNDAEPLSSPSSNPPHTDSAPRTRPRPIPRRAQAVIPPFLDGERWPNLFAKVSALSGSARVAEISRLDGLGDFEMDKEDNIARNQAALKDCQDALPPGLQPGGPRNRQPQNASRRQQRNLGEDDDDFEPPPEPHTATSNPAPRSLRPRDSRDLAGDREDGLPSTPPPEPHSVSPQASQASPPTQRTVSPVREEDSTNGSTSLPAAPQAVPNSETADPITQPTAASDAPRVADLDGAPDWLQAQYRTLAEAPHPPEMYPVWNSMLANWVGLERAFEFLNMQTGISASNRPAEIAVWIRFARASPIAVKNAERYTSAWWKWWDTINPPWRTRSNGRLQQSGHGDWSGFFKTGKNGFLTVLASLVALEGAATDASWRDALKDVSWVLGEVRMAAEARASGSPTPSKRAASADPASRTRKRVKS